MLKDVYSFYKSSPKRKAGLKASASREDKEIAGLWNILNSELKEAKKDLKNIPTLKKWNPTRWLGRAICLKALCSVYEYVLKHLSIFSLTASEPKKHRKTAIDLYERLTSYDTFLFTFYYRDLASMMSKSSKLLQAKDIQIREVGRRIRNLCGKLVGNYPKDSPVPMDMNGDAEVDNVMADLFGKDSTNRTSQRAMRIY